MERPVLGSKRFLVRAFFVCLAAGVGYMERETKLISLADFKAKTDGPGGFEGYISRWGELDDGGDIVAKGAHEETIPQFLEHGFLTNNHDWTFASILGYPVKAYEDDQGTWVSMEFHSTPDAQEARIKTQERIRAGKSARLSMGYLPQSMIVIEPKDYATEIPKYSKPEFVAANLEKAGRFSSVRVLLKDDLFEGALVGMPMLGTAAVTAVKSAGSDGLGTGLDYEAHLEWLGTAIEKFTDRTRARKEMRTKEGRVLSTANYEKLMSLYQQLGELLEGAKPQPKQDAAQEDTQEGKGGLLPEAARREIIRFLTLEAQTLGVEI